MASMTYSCFWKQFRIEPYYFSIDRVSKILCRTVSILCNIAKVSLWSRCRGQGAASKTPLNPIRLIFKVSYCLWFESAIVPYPCPYRNEPGRNIFAMKYVLRAEAGHPRRGRIGTIDRAGYFRALWMTEIGIWLYKCFIINVITEFGRLKSCACRIFIITIHDGNKRKNNQFQGTPGMWTSYGQR